MRQRRSCPSGIFALPASANTRSRADAQYLYTVSLYALMSSKDACASYVSKCSG